MKFLIDEALAPSIAESLIRLGHDSVHVRDLGLTASPDADIFRRAHDENRVVVSADTDFGTLLASSAARKPSVILFRTSDKRPSTVVTLLQANLSALEEALSTGCIAVFEDTRIRVRRTPIVGSEPNA